MHHVAHRVARGEHGRHRRHHLADLEAPVELGSEHDVAYACNVDLANEVARSVGDGNKVGAALADDVHQSAQRHVGIDGGVLVLDDAVEAHQREHRLVGVVGDELAFAGQPDGVDAVGLEEADDDDRRHADDDERYEHLVAAGDLGNEEDARERSVHHAGHDARHAEQGEVLFGNVGPDLMDVPEAREEESAESADEERGCKRSADAASAVGGRSGDDLGQQHQGDVPEQHVALTVEERVVEQGSPVGLAVAVEQDVQCAVAFAVECGEERDEQAEHHSAEDELGITVVAQPGEDALAGSHHADEVETDESAPESEQDAWRHGVQSPGGVAVEREQGVAAHEDVGEAGGGDAGREDGQQGGHREVDHEHLEGEDKACYRGFEDAGNGRCGAASNEQHELFVVKMESLAEVGADGRAREHDGCFGTDRSAEADGDGRRHDRRPAVVALQPRAARGNGVEYSGDAVRYVVLHDVAHEEHRQPDADDREDQIEPVVAGDVELGGEQVLNDGNQPVKAVGRHRRKEADEQGQNNHQLAFWQPFKKLYVGFFFHSRSITLHSSFFFNLVTS